MTTEVLMTLFMCVLVVVSSMIGTVLFHMANEYRRRTEEIKKEMKKRQEGV